MRERVLAHAHGPLRLHRNEPTGRIGNPVATYPEYGPLLGVLAARHDVGRQNLLLTPGADAALDIACRSSDGTAVLLDPDFSRYADHAANAALRIIKVPTPPDGSSFPTNALLDVLDGDTGLVIVSTIGNPTTYEPPLDLAALIRERAPRALIVLDEVYEAFTDVQFTALAASTPGVVSIHSLSKIGFPGLRIGYVVADPATLNRLKPFVSPVAISALSAEAAIDVLTDPVAWQPTVKRQQVARRFLAAQLKALGFSQVREGGNWVLARFGPGARKLAQELARHGVHVSAPDSPVLSDWLRISTPDCPDVEVFMQALDTILTGGPASFVGDELVLQDPFRTAESWMRAPFVLRIGADVHAVDHYAITVENAAAHLDFVATLVGSGATLVEGPGVWPTEFCREMADLPSDLEMHFATLELQPGALLVVAAPCRVGDQLHRFRSNRGPHGVHHVALRVADVTTEALPWLATGWTPLSKAPVVDHELAQWFLANGEGQVIELIGRSGEEQATFTCANIKSLRLAEKR